MGTGPLLAIGERSRPMARIGGQGRSEVDWKARIPMLHRVQFVDLRCLMS